MGLWGLTDALPSADEVQELMGCTYTSKLIFQRTHLLRNYGFWGFSDSVVDDFEQFAPLGHSTLEVSPKVAIGHVSLLDHVEDKPLGLFAAEDLAMFEFLGEYTGVIKVGISEMDVFDPYGISYPSVYEGTATSSAASTTAPRPTRASCPWCTTAFCGSSAYVLQWRSSRGDCRALLTPVCRRSL
jgi:hypothetical protein